VFAFMSMKFSAERYSIRKSRCSSKNHDEAHIKK